MNADVAGAIFLIACAAAYVAARLIHQARTNARHRAVRQRMRAALLEQIRIDHEFEAIVATSYTRKDH